MRSLVWCGRRLQDMRRRSPFGLARVNQPMGVAIPLAGDMYMSIYLIFGPDSIRAGAGRFRRSIDRSYKNLKINVRDLASVSIN